VKTTIAGIPCEIDVLGIYVQKPIPNADSDHDFTGYTDIEFVVCDRRGRPAPWLEAKLTDAERCRIETEILEEEEATYG